MERKEFFEINQLQLVMLSGLAIGIGHNQAESLLILVDIFRIVFHTMVYIRLLGFLHFRDFAWPQTVADFGLWQSWKLPVAYESRLSAMQMQD